MTKITERTDFGPWYTDGSSIQNIRREADIVIRQRSQTNIERVRGERIVAAKKKLNRLCFEMIGMIGTDPTDLGDY